MQELPEFKTGNYDFVRTPNPGDKNYSYYYRNCVAQYACFYKGAGNIPYNRTTKFIELRQFAQGNQPKNFYQNYLAQDEQLNSAIIDPTMGIIDNSNQGKSGYMNVLWDVLSTAPRLMAGMIGTLTRYKSDLSADPIDANSRNDIENEKVKLKIQADNHKFYKEQLYPAIGLEYQAPDMLPEDNDELQIYEDFGKFKPYFAMVMEKVFKHTLDIAGWEEIERKLYADALSLGIMGVIDEYDPEDGKWKPMYVDPGTAGMQWSKYADMRDSTYGWDFFDVNISTVRQYLRAQFEELSDAEFENTVIKDIAKAFLGYQKNPGVDFWSQYNKQDAWGTWKYDGFKCNVMRNRWIDTQGRQDVYYQNKYKQDRTYRIAWDKKEKSTDGKTYEFTEKRKLFQANWIVGTKYIYNWGIAPDQNKPTKRDVSLPYHFYCFDGKSIIEQLIPVFHNFQQLWIKYLNCINSAVNDGYNINVDYLMNIAASNQDDESAKKDGVDYTAIRRFLETGLNYYSTINPTGMSNANTRPIERIPGGMGQMFNDLIVGFNFNLQLVEMLTGINPIVLGGTPSTEAPVGTTTLSVEAVANILKPITDGYMSIKKNMAINIVRYIQLSVKYNAFARKKYAEVFGELDIAVLEAAEGDSVSYGITFSPRPSDLEKQMFIQGVQQAIAAGQLAPFDEVLFAMRLDASIPLKQIMLEMKYRQRAFMKAQAADAQAKSKQEHDNRLAEITAGTQAQSELENKLHLNKMAQIAEEGQWGVKKAEVQEAIRTQKELQVQDMKGSQEAAKPVKAGA